MKRKIINLIICFLINIFIVLVVCILFYDDISLVKVVPEVEEYKLSEDMQKELEKNENIGLEKNTINYELNATDLKKYEDNNEYLKGKKYPFSKMPTAPDIENGDEEQNYYDDDGTK